MTDILFHYGFSERFIAQAAAYEGLVPARVVSQSRQLYRVVLDAGECLAAVSGRFRHMAAAETDFPAVGDFVMLDRCACEGETAVIHAVLPRSSVFIRKAAGTSGAEQVVAANIDTLFICMSLNNDFNLRRLERYLSIAWDSGASPVVVFTKRDLCDDLTGRLAEAESVCLGADIVVTAALESDGCEKLLPYIKAGSCVAFIGSSGVGKSTLINRLIGAEVMDTGGLRDDDKGRHTTTRRELLLLPGGGLVLDTPGMRELGLGEAAEGTHKTFADVEALIENCRFSDCAHTGEPGCAVRAALDTGALDPARWRSYQKLMQEAGDAAQRMAAKEQKMKSIAKINKAAHKKP